jgi:hypothetical protein
MATLILISPLRSDVRELKGCLPKPKKSVSIEQMNHIAKRAVLIERR